MSESTVRLGFDRPEKTFVYAVGALVGTGLGIVVPYLARWATDATWMPFQGPLRLVGSFDTSWAVWGRPVIGLALGIAFAAYVIYQSPVLHVSGDRIEISERGNFRRILRTDVAGIYRDGGKLVVESHGGRRLFHGEVEGGKESIRDAFVSHGYPWEAE